MPDLSGFTERLCRELDFKNALIRALREPDPDLLDALEEAVLEAHKRAVLRTAGERAER